MLENPITEGISGQRILNYLTLKPGLRVLDMGCGPGRLTIPAAEKVGPSGEVVGVDLQPKMLARAQHKAGQAGVTNIRWLQAGAGGGQLETNYYDRALLVTVLGEIPDRGAALAEIYQALKPGGALAVAEIVLDPHYQSQQKVLALAQQVGFQPDRTYGSWLSFVMILRKPTAAFYESDFVKPPEK
jgi:ubiquinone/menaquinone biosynthesis C-methylase UbiE